MALVSCVSLNVAAMLCNEMLCLHTLCMLKRIAWRVVLTIAFINSLPVGLSGIV